MIRIRNVPPGRAGRIWLAARLRTARLAADLLERKLLLLNIEQRRLQQACLGSRERWRQAWRDADTRAARANFLSTPTDMTLSAPTDPADIAVSWANLMGARYPTGTQLRVPSAGQGQRAPGSPAVLAAAAAAAVALDAAAEHAAHTAALRIVTTEAAATRRRLRGINRRWIPRLGGAIAALTRDLDESEREESYRLRRAGG